MTKRTGLFAALLTATLASAAFALDCSPAAAPMPEQYGGLSRSWWNIYANWCSACGGSAIQDDSGGHCDPGPNWGGGSAQSGGAAAVTPGQPRSLQGIDLSRYNWQDRMAVEALGTMTDMATDAMANMVRSSLTNLFNGNPAEDARRAQQQAAAQAEMERLKAIEAQKEQERHDRLMSSLKGMGAGDGELHLKGMDDGGASAGGAPTVDGLALKMGDDASSGNVDGDAMAELQHAAYLSQMAAAAGGMEAKRALAADAFMAARGGSVNLPAPPEAHGVPVSPRQVKEFQALRTQEKENVQKLQTANDDYAREQTKKRILDETRKQAQEKMKDAEAKRVAAPPPTGAATPEKKKEDDDYDETKRLLAEADQLDAKADADLKKAKEKLSAAQNDLKSTQNQERDFVDKLGKAGDAPPAKEHP